MDFLAGSNGSLLSQLAGQPCGAAPISCLFKECLDLFDQLVLCSDAQYSVRRDALESQAKKLRTWGNDARAFTWELDRALRKSSRLQQEVLMLLKCLWNCLQQS